MKNRTPPTPRAAALALVTVAAAAFTGVIEVACFREPSFDEPPRTPRGDGLVVRLAHESARSDAGAANDGGAD